MMDYRTKEEIRIVKVALVILTLELVYLVFFA